MHQFGDLNGAILEYQAILELDMNYAAARSGIAHVLETKGDLEGASAIDSKNMSTSSPLPSPLVVELLPDELPKAVAATIKKGTDYLKSSFTGPRAAGIISGSSGHGIGPTALSGIALLEAKTPASEPAIKAITEAVRNAAYKESRTYQLALCLIYLDILEDPADVPLVQMLAVRLLAGQNADGGWSYFCVGKVSDETEQWLRANLKANQQETQPGESEKKAVPKLHPNVEKYRAALSDSPQPTHNGRGTDDNSNTQFGILGLWLARKHGVPVEASLNSVERRFLASQDQDGGWAYTNGGIGVRGSGSMTAAGLLGLATGVARRDVHRDENKPRKEPTPNNKPKDNDPSFIPGPKAVEPEKKTAESGENPQRTPAVQRGLAAFGDYFSAKVGGGYGPEKISSDRDYYFLWSVERVGVIFGVDIIGGIDWYDTGSKWLIAIQKANGSWGPSQASGGPEVTTSFALLFLCKSDLVRDLSSKFRDGKGKPLPSPKEDESARLANQLTLAAADDWTKVLERLRDAKGGDHTRGLVLAIHRLGGNRKKEARKALAERLSRMSAPTLKGMMGSVDAELRRGAVLAAAMRDDKAHVPDLIDRLTDDDTAVRRAAHAGLKSLTLQDFGPKNANPGKSECKTAATAWRDWWAKQKQ